MIEREPSKSTAWAILFFYLFIGFEILYMISPFGIYYSVYGEGLGFLNENPLTAWLCAFFLPHIATTSSWVMNASKSIGWVLTFLGIVGSNKSKVYSTEFNHTSRRFGCRQGEAPESFR